MSGGAGREGQDGRRRLGDVAVVGGLGAVLWFAGTAGRALIVGLVVLVAVQRLYRRRTGWSVRPHLHPVGSVLAAVGVGAFVLGRVEVLGLALVALVTDAAVGRWRLSRLTFGASTARRATAGDRLEVELRVGGVRGPVSTRLLEPLGGQFHVPRDGVGRLPHLATHRGVYPAVGVQTLCSGWLGTVLTSRVDVVELDAPIVVHPRAVRVAVPVLGDVPAAPDGAAAVAGRGQSDQVRSLRPYVPGDPRRRVHWPTTARQGELAVVEVDGEAREQVTVSASLPEPDADPDRADADQVDLVAGQALYTVHELLRRGVPVRLVTVETDAGGQARTVTAPVRSHDELGRRLAAATWGTPTTEAAGPEWRIGPDPGPARRLAPATTVAGTGPAAAPDVASDTVPATVGEPADVVEPATADGPAADPPADREHDDVVRSAHHLTWAATLAGGFTVVALADQPLPGWLTLGLTLAAMVAATLPWRRVLAPRVAVGVALFAAAGAAAVGTASGRDAAIVAGVTAWVLPRLVMLEVLTRVEDDVSRRDLAWRSPDTSAGHPATRRPRGVVASGALVVLVCVAAVAAPRLWPAVVAAVAVGLLGTWRARTWAWAYVPWSAALAALLASTAGPTTVPLQVAALLAVVVLLAVSVRTDESTAPALDGTSRHSPRWPIAVRVVVVGAVLAIVLAGGGTLLDQVRERLLPDGTGGGAGASTGWIHDADALDLTVRPQLGERVVLTVEADLPAFWRGRTYDRWDGRRWTGDPGREAPLPNDRVATMSDGGRVNRQRITVHAGGAMLLPAAPEPVEVRVDDGGEVVQVVARDDAGLVPTRPVLLGDTYSVTSRLPDATADTLRGVDGDATPPSILERYARPAPLSERTARTIEAVAGDEATVYDQVRALEGWLAEQVTYSRDAPLPAAGADVVDHFLYEARAGWCEQVATTLTLALRHLGVPARLASGYVTGEWDGRRYVVRERHAHAWVEVWFPGVGWQGFDPTAEVPLAGEAQPPLDVDGVLAVAAMAGVGVLLAAGVGAVLQRRRRMLARQAGGAEPEPHPWAGAAAQRLGRIADGCGLDRSPAAGVVEQAARVAAHLGDGRLVGAAAVVLRDAYGPAAATAVERRFVDEVLADAERAVAADRHRVGAGRPVP